MPEFTTEIDIEPSEYIDSCSKSEIKELIEMLVEDGHIPKSSLSQSEHSKSYSKLQQEFTLKLEQLSNKYHSISVEDEEKLEQIFKRYL